LLLAFLFDLLFFRDGERDSRRRRDDKEVEWCVSDAKLDVSDNVRLSESEFVVDVAVVETLLDDEFDLSRLP